jgi:cytochrome c
LSAKFPEVNGGGGRTAMAGPVYYYDPALKSERKLPREFDHTLFIYEWSRNWIIAVQLDAGDHLAKMERFCPKMTFKRPMDMELGPDGCLYVIEWGTGWANNLDTQIIRIEHAGGEK